MILIIIALAAAICIICWGVEGWSSYSNWFFGTVISVAILVLCLIIMLFMYAGVPEMLAANQQIYESLTYQIENHTYDDGIGRVELMKQVTEWNTDLARGRQSQSNFWYGIFVPNVYDNFEFIPLENIK